MRTRDAIDFFGDSSSLAKAIGVTPSAVSQWGPEVPMSRIRSVKLAMKERADELEKEAKRLRRNAKED